MRAWPPSLCPGTTPSHWLEVSAPVPVVAVVSVMAVSIAPTGAVSELMPGLPVSVPAPPVVASRLPPPQAARSNAVIEPRIQDVRFMEMSLSTVEPRGVTAGGKVGVSRVDGPSSARATANSKENPDGPT